VCECEREIERKRERERETLLDVDRMKPDCDTQPPPHGLIIFPQSLGRFFERPNKLVDFIPRENLNADYNVSKYKTLLPPRSQIARISGSIVTCQLSSVKEREGERKRERERERERERVNIGGHKLQFGD
jgi:hypothetical protein